MKCINLGGVINKEEFQAKTDGVERHAKNRQGFQGIGDVSLVARKCYQKYLGKE